MCQFPLHSVLFVSPAILPQSCELLQDSLLLEPIPSIWCKYSLHKKKILLSLKYIYILNVVVYRRLHSYQRVYLCDYVLGSYVKCDLFIPP